MLSFNRTTVECKSLLRIDLPERFKAFNRTTVECKYKKDALPLYVRIVVV